MSLLKIYRLAIEDLRQGYSLSLSQLKTEITPDKDKVINLDHIATEVSKDPQQANSVSVIDHIPFVNPLKTQPLIDEEAENRTINKGDHFPEELQVKKRFTGQFSIAGTIKDPRGHTVFLQLIKNTGEPHFSGSQDIACRLTVDNIKKILKHTSINIQVHSQHSPEGQPAFTILRSRYLKSTVPFPLHPDLNIKNEQEYKETAQKLFANKIDKPSLQMTALINYLTNTGDLHANNYRIDLANDSGGLKIYSTDHGLAFYPDSEIAQRMLWERSDPVKQFYFGNPANDRKPVDTKVIERIRRNETRIKRAIIDGLSSNFSPRAMGIIKDEVDKKFTAIHNLPKNPTVKDLRVLLTTPIISANRNAI